MKLVLDEHFSPAIAEELRRRGHDVVAVQEAGLSGQPDAAVLEWATQKRRAVVTADVADYRGLHELYLSRGDRHFGIVLVSRRFALSAAAFGILIASIEQLLARNAADEALDSAEMWLGD